MRLRARPTQRSDGLVGVLLIVAITSIVDIKAALTNGEPVSGWIRRQPRVLTMPTGAYLAYHFWAPMRWRHHDPLGMLGVAISEWARLHRPETRRRAVSITGG